MTQLQLLKNRTQVKSKSDTMLSKFIVLRLGDAFRFVIYHNQRHVSQAGNVLKAMQKSEHNLQHQAS